MGGIEALILVATLIQTPDLSGTWKLDEERSQVDADVAYAGLIGTGAPDRLHVTQAANGAVVVESEHNPTHARFYKPGEETTTTVPAGQPGSITMTSRWDGARLVSEGRRESKSDTASTSFDVKEVFQLGADGTLQIEISTGGPEDRKTSSLVYTRTNEVGPCESWVSPCKFPPR